MNELHSPDAERAVLGALMLDSAAWDRIADTLLEEDFREDHRRIFRVIEELNHAGEACDALTVSERLERASESSESPVLALVGEIAESTPSAANVNTYAGIVQERARLRAMLRVGERMASSAREGRDFSESWAEAERELSTLSSRGRVRGPERAGDVLRAVMDRLSKLAEGESDGVLTGFTDLDRLTTGLYPGTLNILAGRTGTGKTALALNIVEHAALSGDAPLPVAVFSLEMSGQEVMIRLLSSMARIDGRELRTGWLEESEWQRISREFMPRINQAPLFVDDSSNLTPTELRARCRALNRESALGLVVVDYLQLMHVPGMTDRTREVTRITRELKALARELEAPVLALSQLNRSADIRSDEVPRLAHLRESGSIEQDADTVMLIQRPEDDNTGEVKLHIRKQRNGPTGMVPLTFRERFTRFENAAPESATKGGERVNGRNAAPNAGNPFA